MIPGSINRISFTADTPGEYPGQCAEFCGVSHANMRMRVIAQTPDEFDRWGAEQQAPPVEPSGLAAEGKEIFTRSACVGCHTIRGVSGGILGPDLTHFGSCRTFAGATLPTTTDHVAAWPRTRSPVAGDVRPHPGGVPQAALPPACLPGAREREARMLRSDHVTNILLATIVALLAVGIFRPTVVGLLNRSEAGGPRFGERTFTEWQGYLQDLSPAVRQRAVEALGYFGPKAVPVLTRSLASDASVDVRVAVAAALGALGPAAREALPALIEASTAPEPKVRAGAALALAKVGREVKETVPALVRALEDAEPAVRFAAAQAVGGLGPTASEAVPGLVRTLRDTNPSIQQEAIRALGNVGPAARAATADLRKLMENDQLRSLRPAVEQALAKIEGR